MKKKINMFLFFLVLLGIGSCDSGKISELTKENEDLLAANEALEGELYVKTADLEANSFAYAQLKETYSKVMGQLVDINTEFNAIENRGQEIKYFEAQLVEFIEDNRMHDPIAIKVLHQLNGVVEVNKAAIEKAKLQLSQIQSLKYDIRELENIVETLVLEVKAKDSAISKQQEQIISLEKAIATLQNRLELEKTSCEKILEEKDDRILAIQQEISNEKIVKKALEDQLNANVNEITSLSIQIQTLSANNISLTHSIQRCYSAVDSVVNLGVKIPDCALAYYVIGSHRSLVSKGILVKHKRDYTVNDEVVKIEGNELNHAFSRTIILPGNKKYKIYHPKSKAAFKINGNILEIVEPSAFENSKYLVISYDE